MSTDHTQQKPGGTYGQSDESDAARRSAFRDDQHAAGDVHQKLTEVGVSGHRSASGSTGGSTGVNIGSPASAADRDDERDKSLSSPGGSGPTDRSGVGAPEGVTTEPNGGAGMRGAGGTDTGSSGTMAEGSAGQGAPPSQNAASDTGVTTGSEDKPAR
jgi:hypothetical protein